MNGVRIWRVPVIGRRKLATASLPSLLTYFPSSLARGICLCRRQSYDVIHTHFAVPSGPSAALISQTFGIPNVLSIYGGDIYDPSKALSPHRIPVLRMLVKRLLVSATSVVAESTDIRDRALRHYGLSREIPVIPLGLQAPSFAGARRSELGLSDDDFIIVSVGRLVARKGYEYLIRALARLDIPNTRLLIIGQGPRKDHLASLAASLGVSERVSFLGRVSDEAKFQYLSVSDLFVLPSLHEGFGIVFLEAMFCGLPIIATDTGGQRDFLVNGRNGFLVPPRDSNALADRIKYLYRDADARRRISQTNLVDVERYSIPNVGRQYERLFTDIVGSKNGVRAYA